VSILKKPKGFSAWSYIAILKCYILNREKEKSVQYCKSYETNTHPYLIFLQYLGSAPSQDSQWQVFFSGFVEMLNLKFSPTEYLTFYIDYLLKYLRRLFH